jgi:hypothetical protein
MGRSYLGEFEVLVLLTLASMKGEACGAAITHGIQQKTGRMVVLSAVYVALYRNALTFLRPLSKGNLPFNSLFFKSYSPVLI